MIQDERLKKGYTQSQLSKKCGIPLSTLQKYENGQKNINNANLSSLVRLCIALECDLVDILTDESLIDLIKIKDNLK